MSENTLARKVQKQKHFFFFFLRPTVIPLYITIIRQRVNGDFGKQKSRRQAFDTRGGNCYSVTDGYCARESLLWPCARMISVSRFACPCDSRFTSLFSLPLCCQINLPWRIIDYKKKYISFVLVELHFNACFWKLIFDAIFIFWFYFKFIQFSVFSDKYSVNFHPALK